MFLVSQTKLNFLAPASVVEVKKCKNTLVVHNVLCTDFNSGTQGGRPVYFLCTDSQVVHTVALSFGLCVCVCVCGGFKAHIV